MKEISDVVLFKEFEVFEFVLRYKDELVMKEKDFVSV